VTTSSSGLQRHGNADIFVSNLKEHFMGTIITRSDKEVLHFFDEMKRVSDLIDHLPANNRHLLDGENYLTDTELAGKLKLSKRTLLEYRNNGVLPYYQIGGKILYRESDIVRLLEKNRKEAF
jgi:DNA binding domain, excisionase family protein